MSKAVVAVASALCVAAASVAAAAAGVLPQRSPHVQQVGIVVLEGDQVLARNIALGAGRSSPPRDQERHDSVPHVHHFGPARERAHPPRPWRRAADDGRPVHAARLGDVRLALRHLPDRHARACARHGRDAIRDGRSLHAAVSRAL